MLTNDGRRAYPKAKRCEQLTYCYRMAKRYRYKQLTYRYRMAKRCENITYCYGMANLKRYHHKQLSYHQSGFLWALCPGRCPRYSTAERPLPRS